MKKIIYFILFGCVLLLFGCAQIFNGVALPNQCKRCDLIDAFSGEVLYSLEGCGSQNTNLREKCIEKAWEISRGERLCDFEIKCESWRKEKSE